MKLVLPLILIDLVITIIATVDLICTALLIVLILRC